MRTPNNLKTVIAGKAALLATVAGSLVLWTFLGSANPRTFAPEAAKFVEIDSPAFTLVPNLGEFVEHALPQLAFLGYGDFLDAVVNTPARCRTINSVRDLSASGLDPGGSAMIAKLEQGRRFALRYGDAVEAVGFMRDVLQPATATFTVQESADDEGQSQPQPETENGAPPSRDGKPEPSASEQPPKKPAFEITLRGKGYRTCMEGSNYRPEQFLRWEVNLDTTAVNLPLVLSPSEIASFQAECAYVAPDGTRKPCSCTLGPDDCLELIDLSPIAESYRDDAKRALAGETVSLSSTTAIRLTDGFVYGMTGSVADFKTPVAAASILGDDAFLDHMRRILGSSERGTTTIIGALRPDSVLNIHPDAPPYVPVSLLVPFSARFSSQEIDLQAGINPEPADIALLQRLVRPSAFPNTPSVELGDAVGGLGSMVSDPEMRTYLASLEVIMPGFIDSLRDAGPFSPYILSFLSSYQMPVEVAFLGVDARNNLWRLGMTAQNMSLDEAKRILNEERLREYRSFRAAYASNAARFLLDERFNWEDPKTKERKHVSWDCSDCEAELSQGLKQFKVNIPAELLKVTKAPRAVSFSDARTPDNNETPAGSVVKLGPKRGIGAIRWEQDLAHQEYLATRDALDRLDWSLRKICVEAMRRIPSTPAASSTDVEPKTPVGTEQLIREKCATRLPSSTPLELDDQVRSIASDLKELRRRRGYIRSATVPALSEFQKLEEEPAAAASAASSLLSMVRSWRADIPLITEEETATICKGDLRYAMITDEGAGGVASYDVKRSALDLAFSPADLELMRAQMTSLGSGQQRPDDPGKLRVLFNTKLISKIQWPATRGGCLCGVERPTCGLSGLSSSSQQDLKSYLETFPFPILTPDLYGRGRAMAVRLRMRRDGGNG
jgi:hypothetical protein